MWRRPPSTCPIALIAPAALSAISTILAPGPSRATECDTPHPDWILCEDFERGGLGVDGWYEQSPFVECLGCDNSDRLRLTDDPDQVFDGQWSLHMPATAAAEYRGASLTYRSCEGTAQAGCDPLVGYPELFYRAWVKLAPEHRYVHHFMALGGTRPHGYWEGDGNAGCRPNGERSLGTTVDFRFSADRNEHELFFYTYFPEMGCDDIYVGGGYCGDMQPRICDDCAAKDMPCENGPECCWGNHFSSDPMPILPRGEWICLEMNMRLNTPGQADGEMAFWINDQLGHRQTGMHWRDVAELELNKVWVQHYIAPGDADQSNPIWWDNVVASTSRIGCGEPPPPQDAGPRPDAALQDAAPVGDRGARADSTASPDHTSVGDGPGCAPRCLDDQTLQSCDGQGNPVTLHCAPGQRCEVAQCVGGTDAGSAASRTTRDGCGCAAGHGSSMATVGFATAGMLGWRHVRRRRGRAQ